MEGEQNNVNMGRGESGSPTSPIIGVVIILAIAILGGLYFWSQRAGNEARDEVLIDETVEAIGTQNQADNTTSIEADLEATDIESLDAELNAS